MAGRWFSGVVGADGGSECAVGGHFSAKWTCSSGIGCCTALAGGDGYGSEAARLKGRSIRSRWVSGRWGSAGGESDGDSKCVLEGHFSMKWACSNNIGTALDGGGGSGQGGGRRGGIVSNTRRMPGAG